jgi:hypothetical protein
MTGVGGSRAGTQTRYRGTVPTHTGATQIRGYLRCACLDGGRHRTNRKAGGW